MSSPTIIRQELNMTKKKAPNEKQGDSGDDTQHRMDDTKKDIGEFDAYQIMDQDELLLYYQSALRNVGLYTSVAFAIITYSLEMKGTSTQKLFTRIIGICILIISFSINYILIKDMQVVGNAGFTIFDKWYHINILLMIIQSSLFLLSVYVLYSNYV